MAAQLVKSMQGCGIKDYEEKSLDAILQELPNFESKNALKTMKYKCMENLRKSAQEIYHRYLNS